MHEATAEEVRAVCPQEAIGFATTDMIKPLDTIIGQERAVKALEFGLNIDGDGFNIFMAGLPGTGKNTAVQSFLESIAVTKPVPPDWCYVFNFQEPYRPHLLRLPPGCGKKLANEMKAFINQTRQELPRLFKSDEYTKKREKTTSKYTEERNKLIGHIDSEAKASGFAIQMGPMGVYIIPAENGEPIGPEKLNSLPEERQQEIRENKNKLEQLVQNTLEAVQQLEKESQEALKKLDRQVAERAIRQLMGEMRADYTSYPEVLAYLESVCADILEHLSLFRQESDEKKSDAKPPWAKQDNPFRRYEVNVLVDNSDTKGAPVVVELSPTYSNLFGTIEKETNFGALTTDFTLIRAGSLYRANGGYLVLTVEELLRNPLSWEELKRALRDRLGVIEDPIAKLGFLSTKSIRPEPIPLDLKVILLGNTLYYNILYRVDPAFRELFKVKAEFGSWMRRTPENVKKYAAFLATLCHKERLLHLDASAVASLVEYGSRLAEDQELLSTRFAEIADLTRESCYYARQDGSAYITANHINLAIQEKIHRSNLIQELFQDMYRKGTLLMDLTGKKVGQVNGLSVISLGDLDFGKPTRITASVAAGREGIIDIEREAKLGGRIHTKGVLILTGYLGEKYQLESPFPLSARLVFEQSYEGVEGDSASCAELIALLSAISGLPIKQNLAITGSVNQKGEIQAVGGLNEKIEGFFDLCQLQGPTGDQGVLLPATNLKNLMLRQDVVAAVREGKFHIYLIETVDEALELLTGIPAGQRKEDGSFTEGTVHAAVAAHLKAMTEQVRAAGGNHDKPNNLNPQVG